MSNPYDQMQPILKSADSQNNRYEFVTLPMYDVVLGKWTYKRWTIDWTDEEVSLGCYRLVGSWIDCKEDGGYIKIGEIYEPVYFDSLEDALDNIITEVESYI